MPSSVTLPIGVAVSSHVRTDRLNRRTRPGSATTSIRSCDSESRISYGVIPGSRVGTSAVSISTPTPPRAAISADELVSPAAPMSWIATMSSDVDQLEAGLEQQLLGEGIADLHLWPARFALLRQLLGGEAGAVDAVAPGPSPTHSRTLPTPWARARDQLRFPQQADAHRVDQRVAAVSRGEVDLAAERRDADAVAVVADASDDSGEEVAIARRVQRAEAEAVEHRDRTRAHGEHVAQNAADAGRGALVWLDRATGDCATRS